VTREDSCGNPVYGDNGQVVTKGVVTATFTSVTTATNEIRVTNSGGESCLYEPSIVSLEGFTAEIVFCGMDPDMFEMLTGMPVIYDIAGIAVGIAVDVGVSLENFAFGLEVWTGLASDDACGEVGGIEYGYIVLSFMKGGRLADFSVANGEINFTVADASARRGGSWGKGPYNVVVNTGDVAGPLLNAIASTQIMIVMRTKVAPPAAYVGGRPLLSRSWVTLATLNAVVTGFNVAFDVSPSILAGQGVYYDFGDDTWDYVTTGGGDTTHGYAAPGTYIVTATSGGGVVRTTTVIILPGS